MENGGKSGLKKIYRKSWCYDNIYGPIRFELSAAQRGVWNDLLDLAKIGRVRPGLIAAGPGVGYPRSYLAGIFNVPIDLFEETLEVLKSTKRITENHNGIEIVNWKKYQTEYDRQKPYREATKSKDDPDKYTKGKYGHMVKH